ncbi:MAG: hypothetical protein WC928_03040 [Patescibacteria group bacterium]|jgi:hypothetical protein
MPIIKNDNINFVIKVEEFTGRRIGFLKTKTEKFYLGSDGILSLVPIGFKESVFGGVFQNNELQHIPPLYFLRVKRSMTKLMYMNKILTNKINEKNN